jgi:hypothetical protein
MAVEDSSYVKRLPGLWTLAKTVERFQCTKLSIACYGLEWPMVMAANVNRVDEVCVFLDFVGWFGGHIEVLVT